MDFRTMEITDRTKEDYFTFESPVDYVKTTPNAEKFFKQFFADSANRKDVQRSLGYMMTGDTTVQCFSFGMARGEMESL
jgi:hypothetical protein